MGGEEKFPSIAPRSPEGQVQKTGRGVGVLELAQELQFMVLRGAPGEEELKK